MGPEVAASLRALVQRHELGARGAGEALPRAAPALQERRAAPRAARRPHRHRGYAHTSSLPRRGGPAAAAGKYAEHARGARRAPAARAPDPAAASPQRPRGAARGGPGGRRGVLAGRSATRRSESAVSGRGVVCARAAAGPPAGCVAAAQAACVGARSRCRASPPPGSTASRRRNDASLYRSSETFSLAWNDAADVGAVAAGWLTRASATSASSGASVST